MSKYNIVKVEELPPNLEYPVVENGLGAARGLHPLEHVQWTRGLRHPAESENVWLEPDLRWAVEFASECDIEALDELRRTRLGALLKVAADLEPERAAWTVRADVLQQKLAARIHGPLIIHFAKSVGWPDRELEQDLHGFPLVGRLPPAGYASQPTKGKARCGDDVKLLEDLQVWNEEVLRHVKHLPYAEDIAKEVQKDVDLGAMSEPCVLRPEHREFLLMRRLPVREYKAGKYKTRIADHGTECGANQHTLPSDTMMHDTCDVLVEIELAFMKKYRGPLRKWKRDV